ncbi:MAG: hypothetical protein AAGL69_02960 [Pseudomonadota bacterium]
MSTLVWFLASMTVSAMALRVLTRTNPKRRRVYFSDSQRALSKGATRGLWLALFAPGVAMLFVGQYTAFLSWFGALGTVGWLIAVKPPKTQRSPATGDAS